MIFNSNYIDNICNVLHTFSHFSIILIFMLILASSIEWKRDVSMIFWPLKLANCGGKERNLSWGVAEIWQQYLLPSDLMILTNQTISRGSSLLTATWTQKTWRYFTKGYLLQFYWEVVGYYLWPLPTFHLAYF